MVIIMKRKIGPATRTQSRKEVLRGRAKAKKNAGRAQSERSKKKN